MTPRHDHLVWHLSALPDALALDIIDHVPDPIFVKDRQFRFVVLNRAFEAMVGRKRADMFGKTDFDFFPPEEAAFFRLKDEEMFRTGEAVHIPEEPITDASGRRRFLATTKAPLRSGANDITHLVGIIHDITPIKEAQLALRQANEQLEAKVLERTAALRDAQDELMRKDRLALLGRLAGGLAHQIRNPLGAILNAVSLLRRVVDERGDPIVQSALRVLEEESWAANRIITDLVDFMRARTGTPGPVSLQALVKQVVDGQVHASAVTVINRVPEVVVHVDAVQTVSAVINLVRNSLEAMNEKGTLTFDAEVTPDAVSLLVEDSGPGVSVDIERRLFEPLLTTKSLGLGLGLATAKLLIEAQRGALTLRRARPGAVFAVSLPRRAPER